MSSTPGARDTRRSILDAATALLEQRPERSPTMGEIAVATGISRQALYLHFSDRTELLLELSREADRVARTPARQRRIDTAPTGIDALREAVAVQSEIKPRLRGVATALDAQRRGDEAAAAAWHEREEARLARCRDVIRRLKTEGHLAGGYSVDDAAHILWALTSQRVWDDLVVDQGWSNAKYRTKLTRVVEDTLVRPRQRGT